MKRLRRRNCKYCNELFSPDPRNRRHQKYCSKAGCRKASKAESQRRWLRKKTNQNYFCGQAHAQRVQAWRQSHPGYWRRPPALAPIPLQEDSLMQVIEKDTETGILMNSALQEVLMAQPTVLIGLIANLTGSALQDDIAKTSHQLLRLSRQILANNTPGEAYDHQTRTMSTTTSSNSPSI